ncbi:MAG: SIS domain-containing protein [Acidobacteria bacterium]|nr:SIS domain-containing protein [Acidobacteriota bacterium]MCG3192372.1 Phosphoheptose isomerase [Thermoanaerobaculia bacterium]
MTPNELLIEHAGELIAVLTRSKTALGEAVEEASRLLNEAILSGHKVLTFGNGGSSMQAQHLAAELLVRYKDDRRSLPAVALTADPATITACANDYDFSVIFSRQIEGLGRPGDVAIGLSTSGKSPNVRKGLAAAREKGMKTIFLTGESGAEFGAGWDSSIVVPSTETAHIQEVHLVVIHMLCRLLDAAVFAAETS